MPEDPDGVLWLALIGMTSDVRSAICSFLQTGESNLHYVGPIS